MKAGWEVRTLGEVCEVFNGGTPKTSIAQYWDGPHQWVTPAEMGKKLQNLYLNQTARTITDEGLRDSSAKLLPIHSVILSCRAPIGHLVINDVPMATNQGCKGLIPSKAINHKFLYYFLFSSVDLLNDLGSGTTFKELSGGKLKEVRIPLPPLAEQQRIVSVLDQAFEHIATAKAAAQANLANAKALFESHLQAVFSQRGDGWERVSLANCCEKIFAGGDVPTDRFSKEKTEKYTIPVIANGEKNNGLFGFTDVARVFKPSVTVSARGTIGFTRVRTSPFFPVVRLVVLIPNESRVTLPFLYYAVSGMDFSNTGTSIPQLTVPNLKEQSIYLPHISKQHAFVETLDTLATQTRQLEVLYQAKLSALDALKQSLLHQAFSGAL